MSEPTWSPCPEDERLQAFVTARVDEREAARISTHLLECEDCYRKVASFARFVRIGLAGADPKHPLLPAFATAIGIAIALTIALSWLLPTV